MDRFLRLRDQIFTFGWIAIDAKCVALARRCVGALAVLRSLVFYLRLQLLARRIGASHVQEVTTEYMGSFVLDSARSINQAILENRLDRTLFIFSKRATPNSVWETLIRETAIVATSSHRGRASSFHKWLKGKAVIEQSQVAPHGRDVSGALARLNSPLRLSAREIESGKAWLRDKGWDGLKPIVLLVVREEVPILGEGDFRFWNAESSLRVMESGFRNCSVNLFASSVNWLGEQGAYVIRAGRNARRQIAGDPDSYFDYASSGDFDDLMDIWMFQFAEAVISTGTGPDSLCEVFRTPILSINGLPLAGFRSYAPSMVFPKRLIRSETSLEITLAEYLISRFELLSQYRCAGLSPVDLESETIVSAVSEFWNRLQGSWSTSALDEQLLAIFWSEWRRLVPTEYRGLFEDPWAEPSLVWLRHLHAEGLVS